MFRYAFPQETIIKALVTSYPNRETVAKAAFDFHKGITPGNRSFVINIGSWGRSNEYQEVTISDGRVKFYNQVSPFTYRPGISFSKTHLASFKSWDGKGYPGNRTDWNRAGLNRELVQNGEINPAWVPKETGELDSRTGFGITADNELVVIMRYGWDQHSEGKPSQGETITDIGRALIDMGCVWGGDGDAGGSTTFAVDGEVIDGWYNDGKPMRAVKTHLCLELTQMPGQTEPPTEPPSEPPTPTDEYFMHVKGDVRRKFVLDD